MNTAFLLMAQYEKTALPLSDISEVYFGLSPEEANRRAKLNRLPVPTFQMASSQKSPRLVHVEDLAKHIDTQRTAARKEWEKSQI